MLYLKTIVTALFFTHTLGVAAKKPDHAAGPYTDIRAQPIKSTKEKAAGRTPLQVDLGLEGEIKVAKHAGQFEEGTEADGSNSKFISEEEGMCEFPDWAPNRVMCWIPNPDHFPDYYLPDEFVQLVKTCISEGVGDCVTICHEGCDEDDDGDFNDWLRIDVECDQDANQRKIGNIADNCARGTRG